MFTCVAVMRHIPWELNDSTVAVCYLYAQLISGDPVNVFKLHVQHRAVARLSVILVILPPIQMCQIS